ncbi:Outer dense fiber protein 2-like, partial [Dryobates pubescens]
QLNNENVYTLMQKLSENETQNTNLRRKLLERENQIKELSSKLQLEKVNIQKEDQSSRSLKAIQAHLQSQIQRKEVENNKLKAKMQTLEKKIAEWKLQVGEYKRQILAIKETSEQKKTVLKKVIRFHKQRAEDFEATVENLISIIKEREIRLFDILSASDVWKKQYRSVVEEITMLNIQKEDLEKQITSLLEDLKRKEEWKRNSDEEVLGKLNSINSENERLKTSRVTLENSTASAENELLNLQEKTKWQENLVEQYKNQTQKLQTALEELKSSYETVLNESKRITANKCLEVNKGKAELKELEHAHDLLKGAEEKQQEYQEKLAYWERIHAQKCKLRRELQVQEEDSVTSVGSHSLVEENHSIQKHYEDLKRQLEQMEFQNEELACQLKKEDESLQCSKLQLEEKTADFNGLTRQLESALEDGRKMVAEELEKMSHKEQALEAKMLILETEVRKGQEEKKKLLRISQHNEKHYEVHLKELENSLQKSENKNQSMQNYVKFLKASYITMFG